MANLTQAQIESLLVSHIKDLTMHPSDSEGLNALLEYWGNIAISLTQLLQNNNLYSEHVDVSSITKDNAFFKYIEASAALIGTINSDVINVKTLYADTVSTEELNAKIAEINTLLGDYIKANDIVTGTLTAEQLFSTTAKFLSLVSTNVSAEDITSFSIASDHLVIKDAFITNAMIASIVADKIDSGSINTNKVLVQSADGSLYINGNLVQMKDTNRVRLQFGKDAENNYNFYVWDASGNLMWNALGITSDAIKTPIIVNDMVAPNANIAAAKLNIPSIVDSINNGVTTIKAGMITMDEAAQTLSAWFTTQKSWNDSVSQFQSDTQTKFEVIDGQLNTYVSKTDFGAVSDNVATLSNNYSALSQSVSGISTTVAAVSTTASNAQTAANTANTALNALIIGTRNYFKNSNFEMANPVSSYGYYNVNSASISVDSSIFYQGTKSLKLTFTDATTGASGFQVNYAKELATQYTISGYIYCANATTIVVRPLSSSWNSLGDKSVTIPAATWTKFTHTFTTASDVIGQTLVLFLRNSATMVAAVYFDNLKLEKGNKATDWTPAPEDVDANISTKVDTTTFNQLSDKFGWIVTGGTSQATMTLSSTLYSLVAQNINLTGKVTFNSFDSTTQNRVTAVETLAGSASSTAGAAQTTANSTKTLTDGWKYTGTTEINGGSIHAHSITADQIDVNSLFSGTITVSGYIISPVLKSSDYVAGSGVYSAAGMIVDLRGKTMSTPYFAVDSDGKVYATGGNIGCFSINNTSLSTGDFSSDAGLTELNSDGLSFTNYLNDPVYLNHNGLCYESGKPDDPSYVRYQGSGMTVFDGANYTTVGFSGISTPTLRVGGYTNGTYGGISTNSLISTGWIRTVGATGWYSETYGGGWWMQDSTYIRNFGSKQLLLNNTVYISVSNMYFDTEYGVRCNTTSSWMLRQTSPTGHQYATCLGTSSYDTCIYTAGNVWKGSSTTTYFATTTTSDKRLKEYVCDMRVFEDAFMDWKPIAFKYHDGLYNAKGTAPLVQWGYYAQDIIESFKNHGIDWTQQELVVLEDGELTYEEHKYVNNDMLKMNYQNVSALHTHMIQTVIVDLKNYKVQNDNNIAMLFSEVATLHHMYDEVLLENKQLKAQLAS